MKEVVEPCPGGGISRRQLGTALVAAGIGGIADDAVAGVPGIRCIGAIQNDDGSAGAPPGTPQMPHLLDGYTARPPWKVAGVDYAVGIPAAKILTDWQALRIPNVVPGAGSLQVNAEGTILDGIDFSTHDGAYVTVGAVGTATIRNCRFGGSSLKRIPTGIIDSAAANLIVRNCVFDAAGAGTTACVLFIRGSGSVTLIYNHIHNFPSRIIELLNGGILDYRFNLIGEGAMQSGAHLNYLEFEAGAAAPTVAFNTTAQTRRAASAGEGFQFYFNRAGTMTCPVCANNTMIARGGRGTAVMSYMLHGSVYRREFRTTLIGPASASGNYFDVSSAYGAFYHGSFPGWSFTGNVNMISGRALPSAA